MEDRKWLSHRGLSTDQSPSKAARLNPHVLGHGLAPTRCTVAGLAPRTIAGIASPTEPAQ